MRLQGVVLSVLALAAARCGRDPGAEGSAPSSAPAPPLAPAPPAPIETSVPRFGPPVSAEHLPPALRTLKLGVTTLEEARALFPPAPYRTIEERLDTSMGGSAELLTEAGPNKGLRYGELRIGTDEAARAEQGALGEDYRWVRLRFAALPGRERPVLYEIGVAQLAAGSPAVCDAAAPLARQPAAIERCPSGFTPNPGTDPTGFMVCGGSLDGQRAVTITCMGRLLVYELVLASEQSGSPGAPPPAPAQ
jgi:hypothetical protein